MSTWNQQTKSSTPTWNLNSKTFENAIVIPIGGRLGMPFIMQYEKPTDAGGSLPTWTQNVKASTPTWTNQIKQSAT